MWSGSRQARGMALLAALAAIALVAPAGAQAQATTPGAFGACTKDDAERVWRNSDLPQRIEQEWGEGFAPATENFGVYRQYCRDLTGDGVREMIVALGGPTVSSPTPWAIYQAGAGGTPTIAFAEIRVSYIELSIRGDAYPDTDIRVRQAYFRGSEPNCCPQGRRYRYVRWNGTAFVYGQRRRPPEEQPAEHGGPPAPSGEEGCEGRVTAGPIDIRAACLRRRSDGTYEAAGRARLNGIDFVPSEAGVKILFDPRRLELSTSGDVKVQVGPVVLYQGSLKDRSLRATFPLRIPGQTQLKGFPVSGEARVTLRTDGAEIGVNVGIAALGGVSGAATLQANQENGLRLDALSLKVPRAQIRAVPITDAELTYTRTPEGQDRWMGGATVGLPGPRIASLGGSATFLDGRFAEASGELTGNVGIGPGIFLTAVRARLVLEPEFGLGGGMSVSVGPQVAGVTAATISGDFFYQDGTPATFRISGDIALVKVRLSQGSLAYRTDGRVDFSGNVELALKGFGFNGNMAGWVDGLRAFNAQGDGTVGYKGAGIGGKGVLSTRGGAACADLGLFNVGFGFRWEDFPEPSFDGCDLDSFSEVRAAQAAPLDPGGSRTLRVRRGERGLALAVTGAQGAPAMTLRSPSGEAITPPADGALIDQTSGRLAFRNGDQSTSYITVARPEAGDWTLTVDAGSTPVTQIRRAGVLRPARVRARVRAGRIVFSATRQRGQRIEFVERGADVNRRIATTSRSRGSLRFRPAEGPPGVREVIAVVLQDGTPRDSFSVARFRAGTVRAGRPRGVRIRRTGRSARVTWRGASNASTYTVRVRISDGRSLLYRASSRRRSVTVRGVARRMRVTASVRGVTRGGRGGKARAATSRGR